MQHLFNRSVLIDPHLNNASLRRLEELADPIFLNLSLSGKLTVLWSILVRQERERVEAKSSNPNIENKISGSGPLGPSENVSRRPK